jgi:putative heme-binding domain-containing protein
MTRLLKPTHAAARAWAVALPAAFLLAALAVPAQAQEKYEAADIEYGSRVYAAQCAVCHGATGDTVNGVDLKGRIRRAGADFELMALIATGIPGTAMPAFKFSPAEMTGIVAYVRNMKDFSAGKVALGDATRGQAIFDGKGKCGSCHRVKGRGPRLAPDLSDIGTTRTAATLHNVVVDPNGATQFQNRNVRAVTKDGKVVTGRRLNEDTYSVQLIDEQERLVSLSKDELREYTVAKTASMPAYKNTLSATEISDVVAYLLSLKGLQ